MSERHHSADDFYGEIAVSREVSALAYRVLDAIRLLSPEVFLYVWEHGSVTTAPCPIVGDYLLACTAERWVIVTDVSSSKRYQVFNAYLGARAFEFSWDPHVCRNFLVPALQRALLLEDLASL